VWPGGGFILLRVHHHGGTVVASIQTRVRPLAVTLCLVGCLLPCVQCRLQDVVKKIEEPLMHFDDLHVLGKRLGQQLLPDGGPLVLSQQPPLSPDNLEEFAAALQRIDACMQFMLDHVRDGIVVTQSVRGRAAQRAVCCVMCGRSRVTRTQRCTSRSCGSCSCGRSRC
jgi:hypothetical protein